MIVITCSVPFDCKKGDFLVVNGGRRYKVLEVRSRTQVLVRRTFGQWLKDGWDSLFSARPGW